MWLERTRLYSVLMQKYWLKSAELPVPEDGSPVQGPGCIRAQVAFSSSTTFSD